MRFLALSVLAVLSQVLARTVPIEVEAHRETMLESAAHVRELIKYRNFGLGTLSSVYPAGHELAGRPLALQEYYATYPQIDGVDSQGDLVFLAMPISTVFRNALQCDAEMTFTVADLYGLDGGKLAAGKMRVALFGKIEKVPEKEVDAVKKAYLEEHPDARGWVGDSGPHYSFFVRFRVEKIFAFDGFGNVAYIGWIPLEIYRSAELRSKKQVLKHWPIPIQPEGDDNDALFLEQNQLSMEPQFTLQSI